MKPFPDIFCIVDTETTGMRAAFSRIIDIGIIRIEHGKVTRRYQTLLNPGVSLPPFIKRITNITDDALAGAPTFEEVALEIQELLQGAVFVAHNVAFDYSFVQNEFKRSGIEWNAPKLCSVNLSRALYPKERSHNLDSIIERFDIAISERHRALPDAEAVLAFFKKVSKTVTEEKLLEAIESVMDKTSVRKSLRELPDGSGVYFFYGPEQELLYIGKSKHIRTRVRSHFHKTPFGKEKRIQGETTLIETVSTSGELSALLLEASLIKEESPIYNKALRNRKKLVVAYERKNGDGYSTIELTPTSSITAQASILGVFRTPYQAKQKIHPLIEEHRLCPKLAGLDKSSASCFNYQLRKCDGACVGKVSHFDYNERLALAFKGRRMKVWPYSGPIMITEAGEEGSGTVFIIDEWVLQSAYTYDGDAYQPFLNQRSGFDYDTYKILARYILDPKNKRTIKTLAPSEYKKQTERLTHEYENVIRI